MINAYKTSLRIISLGASVLLDRHRFYTPLLYWQVLSCHIFRGHGEAGPE